MSATATRKRRRGQSTSSISSSTSTPSIATEADAEKNLPTKRTTRRAAAVARQATAVASPPPHTAKAESAVGVGVERVSSTRVSPKAGSANIALKHESRKPRKLRKSDAKSSYKNTMENRKSAMKLEDAEITGAAQEITGEEVKEEAQAEEKEEAEEDEDEDGEIEDSALASVYSSLLHASSVTDHPFQAYETALNDIRSRMFSSASFSVADHRVLHSLRKQISRFYPMCGRFWREWLDDEQDRKNATKTSKSQGKSETQESGGVLLSLDAVEEICCLYERAFDDYLSPALYLDYIYFVENTLWPDRGDEQMQHTNEGEEDDDDDEKSDSEEEWDSAHISRIRGLYELGVERIGLHWTHGPQIWGSYRSFEIRVLNSIQKSANKFPTRGVIQKISAQRRVIRNVLLRQMFLPLPDNDAIYLFFQQFINSHSTDQKVKEKEQKEESSAWFAEVQRRFENAKSQAQSFRDIEESLISALAADSSETKSFSQLGQPNAERLSLWKEYIRRCKFRCKDKPATTADSAISSALPATPSALDAVILAYERAVEDAFLVPELWSDYLDTLSDAFSSSNSSNASLSEKSSTALESLIDRALRNCPWDLRVWCSAILAHEVLGSSAAQFDEIIDKANTNFNGRIQPFRLAWMVADVFRRRIAPFVSQHTNGLLTSSSSSSSSSSSGSLSPSSSSYDQRLKVGVELRAAFRRAFQQLKYMDVQSRAMLPNDFGCAFFQCWASSEADLLCSMEQARQVYEEAIQLYGPNEVILWKDWCELERRHGDVKRVNQIYKRAIDQLGFDWNAEKLLYGWLAYGQHYATPNELRRILDATESGLQQFQQARMQAVIPNVTASTLENVPDHTTLHHSLPSSSTHLDNEMKVEVEHGDARTASRVMHDSKTSIKRKDDSQSRKDSKLSADNLAHKLSLSTSSPSASTTAAQPDAAVGCGILVRNIPFDAADEQLKHFFSPAGNIVSVQLPRKANGKPKGYAVVHFSHRESQQKALVTWDRKEFQGRVLRLEAFDDHHKKPLGTGELAGGSSVPTSATEVSTTAVVNASESWTRTVVVHGTPTDGEASAKHRIREVFESCGQIVAIRPMRDRKTKSALTPMAFVEFANSAAVIEALKLNGVVMANQQIKVERARSGKEKEQHNMKSQTSKQLGASEGREQSGQDNSMQVEPLGAEQHILHPSSNSALSASNKTSNGNAATISSVVSSPPTSASHGGSGMSKQFIPRNVRPIKVSVPPKNMLLSASSQPSSSSTYVSSGPQSVSASAPIL